MAAANESQGLKIAVVVFVTLSVILAVSTYFSYRFYSEADALRAKAEADKSVLTKANSDALTSVESLRKDIGVRAEDADAIKTEIKNEYKKIDDEVKSLVDQVNVAVTKAQAAGANGPELEDAKSKVQQIAAAYRGELNKNFISALSRATDLLKNLALLTNQLALNYDDVKRGLVGANGVNQQKLAVSETSFNTSKADLEAEQKKHVEERQSLLTKVDQYQTDRAKLETEVANLTAKIRQQEEDSSKKLALAQQNLREVRDRVERKEQVLDRPDGKVTYVDYNRTELHANVTRSQGARPQMQFSIFDSTSPGLPTDKPKGTVTLISVGEQFSIAKIEKTNDSINPIRVGDYVYSAAWSPNEPMRFALIGKIDVNRDGRDDRNDLKRMIEAAGGIVDYDLPPPEVGKESGKLTGRDSWYVIDERIAFQEVYTPKAVTANETAEGLKKQSEAIREARLNGVRPMPIERLLPFLGYDYAAPIRGRAEVIDVPTLKRVLTPRQGAQAAPAAPAGAPAPKEEVK